MDRISKLLFALTVGFLLSSIAVNVASIHYGLETRRALLTQEAQRHGLVSWAQAPSAVDQMPAAAPDAAGASANPVSQELSNDVEPLFQLAESAKNMGGKPLGILVIIFAFLVTLSRLLQHYGGKLPGKIGEFFTSATAEYVVPIIASIVGALFTALLAGKEVSISLLILAVLAGLKAVQPNNKMAVERAIKAGEVARVAVTDTTKAAEALAKL